MLDYSEIVPGHLFLGAFPTEADLPTLASLGVEAVLSIVDDRDPAPVSAAIRERFDWAQVPVLDSYWGGVPTVEDLADAVGVLHAWRARGLRCFYVHCLAGQGRSPVAVMAYLVHADEARPMRLTKAIARVSEARAKADPNVYQLRILCDYVDRTLVESTFRPSAYQVSKRTIVSERPERS